MRISRLKLQNFKNKPEAKISKTTQFYVLIICKYNTIMLFKWNRINFFFSLSGKTVQKRVINSSSRMFDANSISAWSSLHHKNIFFQPKIGTKIRLFQHWPDYQYCCKKRVYSQIYALSLKIKNELLPDNSTLH